MDNITAALQAWQHILDAILEASSKGISKGELYACLMIVPGFTLQHFESSIRILTEAGRLNVSPAGWVTAS